ncbi:class I SAM-dependent methyltransferase [Methanobrevibacter sp. OttesenSCG-928-K11]|nr:class I SAM-dependent methyltransferase [Methanobrevibacter sp. OttesenSCG-928-K11]MDL2270588.1 class I SAM-dependent methyltransferase [Methanobrevibacter sp. OttesenSCG-928-I08]
MSIGEKFDDAADRYDKDRKYLIPCFDDFYDIAIDVINFEKDNPKVLDLGAGTGLLSKFLLEKYPNADITLVDLSNNMLDKAKERFSKYPNFKYINEDYLNAEFDEKFDIIMSSLSIHHLKENDKKELYKKCSTLLNEDGIFINADIVLSPSKKLDKIFKDNVNKRVLSSGLDENIIKIANERRKFDDPSFLDTQLNWLKEFGFKEVDVPYKYYIFAIIYGEK